MDSPVSSRDVSSGTIENLPYVTEEIWIEILSSIPKPEFPALCTISKRFKACSIETLHRKEKAELREEILTMGRSVFGVDGKEFEKLEGILNIQIPSLDGLSDIRAYQVIVHEKLALFFVTHPIADVLKNYIEFDHMSKKSFIEFLEKHLAKYLTQFTSRLNILQGKQEFINAFPSFAQDSSTVQNFMEEAMKNNVTDQNEIYKRFRQFDAQLNSIKKVREEERAADVNVTSVPANPQNEFEELTSSFKIFFLLLYFRNNPSLRIKKNLAGARAAKVVFMKEEVDLQSLKPVLRSNLFASAAFCLKQNEVTKYHHALVAAARLQNFGLEKVFKYLESNCSGKNLLMAYKGFAMIFITLGKKDGDLGKKEREACVDVVAKLLEFTDDQEILQEDLVDALKGIFQVCGEYDDLCEQLKEMLRKKDPALLAATIKEEDSPNNLDPFVIEPFVYRHPYPNELSPLVPFVPFVTTHPKYLKSIYLNSSRTPTIVEFQCEW